MNTKNVIKQAQKKHSPIDRSRWDTCPGRCSYAIGQFGFDFDAEIVRFTVVVLRVRNDIHFMFLSNI